MSLRFTLGPNITSLVVVHNGDSSALSQYCVSSNSSSMEGRASTADEDTSPWRWVCEDGRCVKKEHDPQSKEPALALEACKMFCNENGMQSATFISKE
ncbi:unnamed protein product [Leptidea sinapis]|uniref:Uncharacterized protein n=1 Tax=Leptidea sinapis TaxID=189913 RepID=A0A5E4Q091_9NEOP|nr:unnamed protein product [Leptidea sinapis]